MTTNPKIVTISGADDDVDIEQIKEISKEFPFVEWGILFSPNNYGKARYPSKSWLNKFEKIDVQKSIHLCGPAAKSFSINGKEMGIKDQMYMFGVMSNFNRLQINIARQLDEVNIDLLVANLYSSFVEECILQIGLNSENRYKKISKINTKVNGDFDINLSPFLDVSGGQGLKGEWKLDFEHVGYRGFAGGINPDNVRTVLETIKSNNLNNEPYWIDMESGVRVDDKLDLNMVKKVLSSIY